jgi:DEAD/DEAH box helicase
VFGIAGFRPGQQDLLAAALGGRDAVGVLPTGGGKSLVYQLASPPRPVVVVTPLISLAEDQTDKLEHCHVAATRLDSSLCAAEARLATAAIAGGQLAAVESVSHVVSARLPPRHPPKYRHNPPHQPHRALRLARRHKSPSHRLPQRMPRLARAARRRE